MTTELVDAFQRLCRDHPDRPLVHLPATGSVVTVTDLAAAASMIDAALRKAGVSPQGLVVSGVGNRPAALALFLCCRQRGGPLLPLDSGTTAEETSAVALQFDAAALLLTTPQPIAGFARTIGIAPGLTLALSDTPCDESRYASAAVLKMTSGSSGAPRATLTPETALVNDSRALMTAMGIGANDTQIAAIPLSHAYGLGNLVVPLFLQGTAIVMREAFVPQRLPEDARAYHARHFPGVPFMFAHLANHPSPGGWPPSLTRLITAGAPIEHAVAERFFTVFGVKIRPLYGTSETGGITYDDTEAPTAENVVGRPLPGVTLTLVPHDDALEGGGRVHVRGPAVIGGYADGADPGCFFNDGFLTGDLGIIDQAGDHAGQLRLSGRVSSFVNIAGRKVQPYEVERVLRTLEGCLDVRVLGVIDPRRGEQLVACLVMAGRRPSLVSLRQFCGARLASHKIPRSFVFLDQIPLTARGKTDRRRLEQAAMASLTA